MAETAQNPMERAAALVARLQASFGLVEGAGKAEDGTPLKYVIYARKSTDTAEKQERSVGDQVTECRNLAGRFGLRVVEVFHEAKSAMVSDKREQFRIMLDGIKACRYDGILAWAPDRLARNMKEAGEIIYLLDHGIIRDIKFSNNFTFNNDPSGKMLLGIAFIMAKQFSDSHSQTVSSGIKNKTLDDKWAGNRGKPGYYKDKAHFFRPDGEHKSAFVMKADWL